MGKFTFKGNQWDRVFIQEAPLTPTGNNQHYSGGAGGAVAGISVPASAEYALWSVEGSTIRWHDDGTTATAASGMLMSAGEERFYIGDLNALSIFMASDASINIFFYQ